MGRPPGSRNAAFEERRAEIARAISAEILRGGGPSASLRGLAAAADVSVPTLRHYFGDREGALAAGIEHLGRSGAFWTEQVRSAATDQPLGASVRWFLDLFALGWQRGVGPLFSQAMATGMDQPALGPAVVTELLEPVLAATEARLLVHAERGEIGGDLRHAALELVCPVLVALLHQHSLGGARCRPLHLPTFLDDHVERFVRAWNPADR